MMRFVLALAFLFSAAYSRLCAQTLSSPPNSPLAAQSEAGTPLTLNRAEAIALKNNPRITVGRLRALVAQQYVR